MDTFDYNFGGYRGMESSETILVSQGQILDAELYDYSNEINIPRYSVGTIESRRGRRSTAWISNIVSTPVWHRYCVEYYKVIATAITAAHTIYFDENGLEDSWYFCVDPEKEDEINTFTAAPFIDFVDTSKSYKDPMTGNDFYLPGDIMIFLIFETPSTTVILKPLEISTREPIEEDQIVVFGYPDPFIRNSRLERLCPLSIKYNSINYRDVLRAIHGGNKLVKSSGKILRIEDLMCVSCTSVSGMSGSPACVIENGEYKVVGILLGGAAAPFQKEIVDIIDREIRRDWLNAERILNHVMGSRSVEKYCQLYMFEHVKLSIRIRKPLTSVLWDLHANLAPNYVKNGHGDKANHNLVLSKTSDPFMLAIEISRKLSEIESQF